MKILNKFVMKVGVLLLVFVFTLSSCNKEEITPAPVSQPEVQAPSGPQTENSTLASALAAAALNVGYSVLWHHIQNNHGPRTAPSTKTKFVRNYKQWLSAAIYGTLTVIAENNVKADDMVTLIRQSYVQEDGNVAMLVNLNVPETGFDPFGISQTGLRVILDPNTNTVITAFPD